MGVDYYTCAICKYNFPDCGSYISCDTCGNHYCDNNCGKHRGDNYSDDANEEKESCVLCRKEDATASNLLNALLKHFSLNRNDALEIYKKQK
jgi:hypothetical protein